MILLILAGGGGWGVRTNQLRVQLEECLKGLSSQIIYFKKAWNLCNYLSIGDLMGRSIVLEFHISASTFFYAYKSECTDKLLI